MSTTPKQQTALITGVNGQDGSYLAELLISKGYRVVGLHRRSSTNTSQRLESLIHNDSFILKEFDITDAGSCSLVLKEYEPDYVYNLAAQSHVFSSFSQPVSTFETNTVGVINLLESIRSFCPSSKFYQASTSEMFGANYNESVEHGKYQDENTAFLPQSPYAVAKLASHRMVQIYRESYGLFACSGILFNHESPRRGENFVTRKITKYIGELVNGHNPQNHKLKLGNIYASRDWGYAADYVEAMALIMESEKPEDYVISTGLCYTVEDFLELAFEVAGLNHKDHVIIDPSLYRPAEVGYLKGISAKAQDQLGWRFSVGFEELTTKMVLSDIKALSKHG